VEKHRGNPQYFKGKKLQSKIFNQFNIKKVKLTDNFREKNKKKEKGKKKCKKKVKKERKSDKK
jgi:hypothetical protein